MQFLSKMPIINIARAFRWQALIDKGKFSNVHELARAIGIPAAENHQYPIHLPPVLVISFGHTVLKHRIPVLRSLRFDNDCVSHKEQRKKKYHS